MRFKEFKPIKSVLKVFGKAWGDMELAPVSAIIPAFNESKTIASVIEALKKTRSVSEIIVVDDGSTDATAAIARKAGARVVRHAKNLGKGHAIKTGVRRAKNDVLLFVDGDLENISPSKLFPLIEPVALGQAPFAKATFKRGEGGRVTELAAKPLLGYLFPGFSLSEPLSGQFCATRELLERLDISNDWGVDIALVLDALEGGEKIVEVNIGSLKHKHRSLSSLAVTSRHVIKTILQRAGFFANKHKLIVLDFDKTLAAESSISFVSRKLGFERSLERERKKFYSGRITERQLTQKIAFFLKGKTPRQLAAASSELPKTPYAVETLTYLKRMGYTLAVVSYAFKQVITAVFPQGFFDAVFSPDLTEKNGVFTGECKVPFPNAASRNHVFSKGAAFRFLLNKYGVRKEESIAVGDSTQDLEMFEHAGLSICINPSTREVERSASVQLNSLAELIVLAS